MDQEVLKMPLIFGGRSTALHQNDAERGHSKKIARAVFNISLKY
jgi:hypothetical protein